MRPFKGRNLTTGCFILGILSLCIFPNAETVQAEAIPPELPRVYIDTTMPETAGYAVVNVPDGGDLQAAIDNASCGTVVKLEAGATYEGNYFLRNKGNCDGRWIIITSSEESQLPPSGTRISPTDVSHMAKLVDHYKATPIIQTEMAANHYRLIGLEIASSNTTLDYIHYNLVVFGVENPSTEDQLAHHMFIDRCYIHGTPTGDVGRGVAANANYVAIVDSNISDIHLLGFEIQAIAAWESSGPMKIVNNYLEASGINILFGGAKGTVPDLIVSDVEIRRNHFYKPVSWRDGDPSYAGTPWTVKNLLEFKQGRRILLEGNIFENNWAHAQSGHAIVLTPRSAEEGAWPNAVVNDITFRKNIVRHSGNGIGFSGADDYDHSKYPLGSVIQQNRVLIENNIWEDLGAKWGGSGWIFEEFGAYDVTIKHNTGFSDGAPVIMESLYKGERFTFTDNLVLHNVYGVFGSGKGTGIPSLDAYTANYTFEKNGLILNINNVTNPEYYWMTPSYFNTVYPPNNFFPMSISEVGFTNYNNGNGGNYTLLPTSAYKNAGTDGKDIGANYSAVIVATRGAVSGMWDRAVNLSPASQSFGASGGTGIVNVTSYIEGSWSSESQAGWITITSGAMGSGDGQVNYTVAANTGATPRSGTVTIGGETFAVNQAAVDSAGPSVPIGLSATAISSSQITLSWTASTDNVAVAGYRIYRNGKQIGTTTGTTYEDTGLRPKITYRYQLAAYDGSDNVSAKSKAVSRATQPLPSTKFSLGDRVQVTGKIVVRSTPSNTGASTGTQAKGAMGTVIGGPSYVSGTWWWQIEFDNDPDGWVLGGKLRK